jgi:uncharacterized protein (DUF4213/DUF364 family)
LKPILIELKEKLEAIAADRNMGEVTVRVKIGTLSVKQAIGSPKRQDYPLLQGKEVMIEAQFRESCGQAFTDKPGDFEGTLNDVLRLPLDSNEHRAIFIATLNAVAAYQGMVTGTRHCRNEEPEECAREIARTILDKYGRVKVGMIGLQPAILENLAVTLGKENVLCTDLNPDNIGATKYGVVIRDGKTETDNLIRWCDLVLATSSTIVNNSFDGIRESATREGKRLVIFGVTGAGAAALAGLERLCFKGN